MRRLPVAVAGADHEMLVGTRLLDDASTVLSALADGLARRDRPTPKSIFMVVDDAVESTHAARLRATIASVDVATTVATVHASEPEKSLDTLGSLAQRMVAARVDRHGLVLAVGGGIVGDLAGFAAATILRGVPCAQVPTTLLAMVDAAIGGKTGVNLPLADGALGKNLVGTFTQPIAVLADPTTLTTLPPRILRCGFAECVKHALICDAELLDEIEREADALLGGDVGALEALVARSAAIKIAVVVQDEREGGVRAHLNLGHTFGHAIESETALGLMHGEAVSVGLVAALDLATSMGRAGASDVDRVVALLERLGLPTRLPGDHAFTVDAAMARMGFDKKTRDGTLNLIVPDGLGRVGIVANPPDRLVRDAWRRVGAA